jgi:hypothetical protein
LEGFGEKEIAVGRESTEYRRTNLNIGFGLINVVPSPA